MKNFKQISPILVLIFVLVSCAKLEPEEPYNNVTGDMSAKVDGNSFEATTDASAVYNSGTLLISGYNENEQLQLTIYTPDASTGTYYIDDMTDFNNTAIYVHSQNTDENYYNHLGDNTGEIELTEFSDTKAIGTFQFTATNNNGDDISVTDGSFDLDVIKY